MITEAFVLAGYAVIVGARRESAPGGRFRDQVTFVQADVRQEKAHQELVECALEKFGRLDAYVNNAGFSEWRPIGEIDEAFFDEPDRWIDLGWESFAADTADATARLNVDIKNESGALAELCTIIAKAGGNISNLKVIERTSSFFQFAVDIEVRDVKHVTNIMTALRASPVVGAVERVRG